jgi:C-terminal processing protease CtpA/Prc
VVGDVADLLRTRYVFPERGSAAAAELSAREAAGAYAGLDDEQLSVRLTADLDALCHDRHLRVRVRPADVRDAVGEADWEAAYREQQRTTNYGIAKVERLPGNVGLIELRGVTDPAIGGRAIAAAMELVSRTEALILDLRRNRGGAPQGVAMWCSYFFPDDETHLNDVYDAVEGTTRQFWTWQWLPGERYLDRPVWVLVSGDTFSGGEELAYNLKVQRRARLVGATTRGGAHPTTTLPLSATLEISIPAARAINPVTGTNWEGVGVEPDDQVDPERALEMAHLAAAEHAAAVLPGTSAAQEALEVVAEHAARQQV